MAQKEISFVIKVNNKEVDLSKTSFEKFDKIVKQAKKDLTSLPLSDPRYKVLNADIKNAEASWKAAQKAAASMGDEMDKGDDKIKSYTSEIKKLVLANRELEQQGLKNSQAYEDNVAKIKTLRDAQEEMSRSTQKLDDALSNIPGPIGQIGSSMQQLEQVSQSAQSAFKSLGLGFTSFDKILKTSLVGFLIGLLVTLVGAVMEAAKSFQPLKDAFAKMSDAVSSLFDALKPVTDFLLNVFVGGIKLVAEALSGLAKIFGGTDKGLAKMTLNLEREIKKQEGIVNEYGSFLSKNYTELVNLQLDYLKKKKEITDDETLTDQQKLDKIKRLDFEARIAKRDLQNAQNKEFRDKDNQFKDEQIKTNINYYSNERKIAIANAKEADADRVRQLESEAKFYGGRLLSKFMLIKDLKRQDAVGNKDAIKALEDSFKDEKKKQDYINKEIESGSKLANSEQNKLQKQFDIEDKKLILERSQSTRDLKTSLIKEEAQRELQAAEDNLKKIKENNQAELDEIKRTGVTKIGLIEEQAAKVKSAEEAIRVAKLNLALKGMQDEIDNENRLLSERSQNSMEFYEKQAEIVEKEFIKEFAAADGNAKKQEEARTNRWNKIYQIDLEKLNTIAELQQRHTDTLNDHTREYFKQAEELENDSYAARVKAAKDNYYLLEIIEEEHQKKLKDLKKQEIQAYGETASATIDAFANLGNAIAANYDEEAKTSKDAFEKRKKLQLATAYMSAASGVIQILTQPSTLPSPFDWIVKGVNAAALLIATNASIKQIKATKFEGSGGGTKAPSMGKNYGDGGMIDGPRHSNGGVPITAEGGEAVMTRGAVTMFQPLLSMMNQAGGGTSFTKGAAGQANYDNPQTQIGQIEQPIIKTYVVENELTTIQHRTARLKDLSTL